MSIHINLELTDHCNIKCKMCSQSMRDEAHGAPMTFMDWATWVKSINDLAALEEPVHLCPHWLGEPTIHPHFDRFLEYAFAQNSGNRLFHEFKLHTNGVVFSERRSRLLLHLANLNHQHESTFRFIHFSIDAFSQSVYKTVKGADRQEQVYRNIETFLALRHALGYRYPLVTLAFVVQAENAHEASDFNTHWTNQLERLQCPIKRTTDWPNAECDTIYFRRLNCGEQAVADRLHESVAKQLGIIKVGEALRASESF
ncbi:MAG: radical SAM protein [Myxococcota bacterium]|nr:radical SAM protein [Myxococcota bacterium]MEC8381955.1 radical SAM protein [Myxococcota bacterium]